MFVKYSCKLSICNCWQCTVLIWKKKSVFNLIIVKLESNAIVFLQFLFLSKKQLCNLLSYLYTQVIYKQPWTTIFLLFNVTSIKKLSDVWILNQFLGVYTRDNIFKFANVKWFHSPKSFNDLIRSFCVVFENFLQIQSACNI